MLSGRLLFCCRFFARRNHLYKHLFDDSLGDLEEAHEFNVNVTDVDQEDVEYEVRGYSQG